MNKYKCIILKKTVYNHANTANIAPPPLLDDKNTKGREDIYFLVENTRSFYHERKSHGAYFDYLNP